MDLHLFCSNGFHEISKVLVYVFCRSVTIRDSQIQEVLHGGRVLFSPWILQEPLEGECEVHPREVAHRNRSADKPLWNVLVRYESPSGSIVVIVCATPRLSGGDSLDKTTELNEDVAGPINSGADEEATSTPTLSWAALPEVPRPMRPPHLRFAGSASCFVGMHRSSLHSPGWMARP